MKKAIIWVVIIIIIIGAYFYSSKQSDSKDISIGLISPLSGQYAAVGENIVKGAQMAIDEYKTQTGKEVKLFVEDDGFEAKKGLSAYRKLIDLEKVKGLINGTSVTIDVIYSDVSKLEIPVVTYGSQSEEEKNDNVFHIYPSSIPIVKALAQYISENAPTSTVSALVTNDTTTQRFFNAFKSELKNNLVEANLVNSNVTDTKTEVTKIISANPDYVFLSNHVSVGTKAIKDILLFRKNGSPKIIFDLTFNEVFSEYQKVLGDMKILNGSIIVSVKGTNPEEFAKKYREKYGTEPGILADYGYDAATLLLKTYDGNKSKWVNNLSKVDYVGFTGLMKFDEVGRRLPEFRITEMKGGIIPLY